MMMDRDEQDIKRAFESIETPEYDIASVVLREKSNRCEVAPLRKVAVMAVSLLVVVSLISVIAIANFSQGKWVDPGSSVLPLAGNDMEQRDETSEAASSLVITSGANEGSTEESLSPADQTPTGQAERRSKEMNSLADQANPNEISIVYDKENGAPSFYYNNFTEEIASEEEWNLCLENFTVPIESLKIPDGYRFSDGSVSYPIEDGEVSDNPVRIAESENFVCFFYDKPERRMNRAMSLSARFISESNDKFINYYICLSTGFPTNRESDEERYGFDYVLLDGEDSQYPGNGYIHVSGEFIKEIDPIGINFASAFGDKAYEKNYGEITGGFVGEGRYRDHREYECLSIHISSSALTRDETVNIAQSVLENIQ